MTEIQPQESKDWSTRFPTADHMYEHLKTVQGDLDRLRGAAPVVNPTPPTGVVPPVVPPVVPQSQPTDPFNGFAARLEAEHANGQFSAATLLQMEQLGLDPTMIKGYMSYYEQQQFEKLQPFLQGNAQELGKAVLPTMGDAQGQMFNQLLQSGQHAAAAAMLSAASNQPQPAQPQIGVIGGIGSGFASKDEFSAVDIHKMQSDEGYKSEIQRKMEATDPKVIAQWQSE